MMPCACFSATSIRKGGHVSSIGVTGGAGVTTPVRSAGHQQRCQDLPALWRANERTIGSTLT